MKIINIVRIVCAIFALLGVVFLFRIIAASDDDIKMAASMGDFELVSPLISLALLVISLTIIVTLVFSLINLATSPGKLKKSLIFLGCFVLVIIVAYVFSSGVETPLKDEKFLSASGSRWIETGIRVFYILSSVAVLSMIVSGSRNIISK